MLVSKNKITTNQLISNCRSDINAQSLCLEINYCFTVILYDIITKFNYPVSEFGPTLILKLGVIC